MEISCVDQEIKNEIREQALAAEKAREHMAVINQKSAEMVETIRSLKQRTGSAQNIIQNGCSEIKRLDTVKRNITFSITSLKRLIMLSKSMIVYDFSQYRVQSSSAWLAWRRGTKKLLI